MLRPCRPQVLGTAVLITGILAITDTRNHAVPRGLEPVAVALLVLAIEVSMGSNCGCPMNPARDLGPRLFTLLAGWGTEVFRWVRAVGPGGEDGGAPFGRSTPTAPLAAGAARGGGCRWWPRWWGPRWARGSISSSWPSTTPRRRRRRTAAEHAGRPSTDGPAEAAPGMTPLKSRAAAAACPCRGAAGAGGGRGEGGLRPRPRGGRSPPPPPASLPPPPAHRRGHGALRRRLWGRSGPGPAPAPLPWAARPRGHGALRGPRGSR